MRRTSLIFHWLLLVKVLRRLPNKANCSQLEGEGICRFESGAIRKSIVAISLLTLTPYPAKLKSAVSRSCKTLLTASFMGSSADTKNAFAT